MVPREVSRAVTVAFEMTAPETSVTVPVIVALISCPKATEHTRNRKKLFRAMRFICSLHFNLFLTCSARCGSCSSHADHLLICICSLPEEELCSSCGSIGGS